jgi:demethylmenaquinone methyltransferase/2-methoxy-6-polyprenyl-1,4-benzoquinol methylase
MGGDLLESPPDPKTRHGEAVAQMFGAIAPTYDLLNHLLSFNVDRRWRRLAVKALDPRPNGSYLDLCTGTGDLAMAILRGGAEKVTGADFSGPMLSIARRKAESLGGRLLLTRADALAMPFPDGTFDGLTVAFGVRNFEDLDRGLTEMARVLKPGGRVVVLEFSTPRNPLVRAVYHLYFHHVLPAIGRLLSRRRGAYRYLPDTVRDFPDREAMALRMRSSGFVVSRQRGLTFGIATLHVGERPSGTGAVGKG